MLMETKEQLHGDLIAAFQYTKGAYRKDGGTYHKGV